MTIGHTMLGLLESAPRHGYDLKQAYDERFGQGRTLAYGQVYSTLARLLRDELVAIDGVESGDGPERKRYRITDAGRDHLEKWLDTPEKPVAELQNTLHTKLLLAALSGRDAHAVLDRQRQAHLTRMRTLTKAKKDAVLADQLAHDFALFHLEADLRWLELAVGSVEWLNKGETHD